MRVLRLCSVFEPAPASLRGRGARLDPIGGMQTHAAALTRALDGASVEQAVVTAFRSGSPLRERLGERVVVYRVGLPLARLRQLWSVPALGLAASLGRSAHVVHVHQGEDLAVLPIGVAAARLHRLPLVVTLHTSLSHTLPVLDPRTALLKVAGARIERWGARRADYVVALTPRVARLLAANGVAEERIAVVPSGVEAERFGNSRLDPFRHVPRPRVLFLGRLAPQKDLGSLLRAVPLLTTRGAHLLVVGDGPQRAALEAEARSLGVAGRVHFAGFVPHEKVPAALAHADVLALPSVYEELGSVLLEAMWAGLPVVASDTGGVRDAVDGAALLVPPRAPDALARALDSVLSDAKLAARLRVAGLARAAPHDWALLAERVLALYERALGGERASAS